MNSIGVAALLSVVLSGATAFALVSSGVVSAEPKVAAEVELDDADDSDLSDRLADLERKLANKPAETASGLNGLVDDLRSENSRQAEQIKDLQAEIDALKSRPAPSASVELSEEQLAGIMAKLESKVGAKANPEQIRAGIEAYEEEQARIEQEEQIADRRERFQEMRTERPEQVRTYLEAQAERLNLTTAQIDTVVDNVTARMDSLSSYGESIRSQRVQGIEVSNESIKQAVELIQQQNTDSVKLALTEEQYEGVSRQLLWTDAGTLMLHDISPREIGLEMDLGRRGGGDNGGNRGGGNRGGARRGGGNG